MEAISVFNKFKKLSLVFLLVPNQASGMLLNFTTQATQVFKSAVQKATDCFFDYSMASCAFTDNKMFPEIKNDTVAETQSITQALTQKIVDNIKEQITHSTPELQAECYERLADLLQSNLDFFDTKDRVFQGTAVCLLYQCVNLIEANDIQAAENELNLLEEVLSNAPEKKVSLKDFTHEDNKAKESANFLLKGLINNKDLDWSEFDLDSYNDVAETLIPVIKNIMIGSKDKVQNMFTNNLHQTILNLVGIIYLSPKANLGLLGAQGMYLLCSSNLGAAVLKDITHRVEVVRPLESVNSAINFIEKELKNNSKLSSEQRADFEKNYQNLLTKKIELESKVRESYTAEWFRNFKEETEKTCNETTPEIIQKELGAFVAEAAVYYSIPKLANIIKSSSFFKKVYPYYKALKHKNRIIDVNTKSSEGKIILDKIQPKNRVLYGERGKETVNSVIEGVAADAALESGCFRPGDKLRRPLTKDQVVPDCCDALREHSKFTSFIKEAEKELTKGTHTIEQFVENSLKELIESQILDFHEEVCEASMKMMVKDLTNKIKSTSGINQDILQYLEKVDNKRIKDLVEEVSKNLNAKSRGARWGCDGIDVEAGKYVKDSQTGKTKFKANRHYDCKVPRGNNYLKDEVKRDFNPIDFVQNLKIREPEELIIGLFLVNEEEAKVIIKEFFDKFNSHVSETILVFSKYTSKELMNLAEQYGFKIAKTKYYFLQNTPRVIPLRNPLLDPDLTPIFTKSYQYFALALKNVFNFFKSFNESQEKIEQCASSDDEAEDDLDRYNFSSNQLTWISIADSADDYTLPESMTEFGQSIISQDEPDKSNQENQAYNNYIDNIKKAVDQIESKILKERRVNVSLNSMSYEIACDVLKEMNSRSTLINYSDRIQLLFTPEKLSEFQSFHSTSMPKIPFAMNCVDLDAITEISKINTNNISECLNPISRYLKNFTNQYQNKQAIDTQLPEQINNKEDSNQIDKTRAELLSNERTEELKINDNSQTGVESISLIPADYGFDRKSEFDDSQEVQQDSAKSGNDLKTTPLPLADKSKSKKPIASQVPDIRFGYGYRSEILQVDTSELGIMINENIHDYLMANKPEYREKYYAMMNESIDLAIATNSSGSNYENGNSPLLTRFRLAYLVTDKLTFGKAFNKLRDDLLEMYFDYKTGRIKDICLDYEPTKRILDFIYDLSGSKEFYENLLKKASKLYGFKEVLRENKYLWPKNFNAESKRPLPIKSNRDLRFMKLIKENPKSKQFLGIIKLLNDHSFAKAKETISNIKCSSLDREALDITYRLFFVDAHNKDGIYKGFIHDPILKTLTPEFYDKNRVNFRSIESYNSMLLYRHIWAGELAKLFGIKDLYNNSVIKEYVYGLIDQEALLKTLRNPEIKNEEQIMSNLLELISKNLDKQIKSLINLSSNSESSDERRAYYAFFNDYGVLKNLTNNKLLEQRNLPKILSTEKAKILRKYLNCTLSHDFSDKGMIYATQILDYIIAAANCLESNNSKSKQYANIVHGIYNALVFTQTDKTILLCSSDFLEKYEDIERQGVQDMYIDIVSQCINFTYSASTTKDYYSRCAQVKKIISQASICQELLKDGNIKEAKFKADILIKSLYQIIQ